jgi:hypothetical protein
MKITLNDFARLYSESCEFNDHFLRQAADGRFECFDSSPIVLKKDKKYKIYWLGEEYSYVLFAKIYLESVGVEYHVVWDIGDIVLQYAIITEFDVDQYTLPYSRSIIVRE